MVVFRLRKCLVGLLTFLLLCIYFHVLWNHPFKDCYQFDTFFSSSVMILLSFGLRIGFKNVMFSLCAFCMIYGSVFYSSNSKA